MKEMARAEVADIHRFFVEWISGRCENSDAVFEERLTRRLAPTFRAIYPTGEVRDRGTMIGMLRHGWGTNPAYEVDITDVIARPFAPDTVVVTYQEWQRNAIFEQPSNHRLSSAILRLEPGLPGGLIWLHLHETWLDE